MNRRLIATFVFVALSWTRGRANEDPCATRTDDVPCLHVSACSENALGFSGGAAFADFKVSDASGTVPAAQGTEGGVCYDDEGLHVHEQATEAFVFSPYTTCNSDVFAKSDVLEVFLAPVTAVTDNPQWYYELDTSPSGALWAGLINNTLGNVSTCVSVTGCPSQPGLGSNLPCHGLAAFPHNLTVAVKNVTGGYTTRLFIPWALFAPEFQPLIPALSDLTAPVDPIEAPPNRDLVPWPLWRINFYRYDYPTGPNAEFSNYELSAWSPTHSPSFHEPSRFGVMVLD